MTENTGNVTPLPTDRAVRPKGSGNGEKAAPKGRKTGDTRQDRTNAAKRAPRTTTRAPKPGVTGTVPAKAAKPTAAKERPTRYGNPEIAADAKRSRAEVAGGPAAWLHPLTGEVLPFSATAYPELLNGELRCLAGQEMKAAHAFPWLGNKGSGQGRGVECRTHRDERLKANKERKAKGQPAIDRPRAKVIAPAAK